MKIKLFTNVIDARQFVKQHNKHSRTITYVVVMYGDGLYWVDSYKPNK